MTPAETAPAATPAPDATITCQVTPWYFKRMGLMVAMFVAMGAYFCYDGKFGYPKANLVAEKKAWYEKEVIGTKDDPGTYEEAKAQGDEAVAAWMKQARDKGWVIKADLKEPRWDDYAAPHGWASKPKLYSPEEIEQQYQWGGGMFLGAVITGLMVLFSRNKTFIGHASDMVMPDGKTVRFADVFKVDKRKWDNKGLAYAYYRETEGGPERKAVIDDLKYDGAVHVLDRLLAQFSGELIEKIADPEDEGEEAEKPAEEQIEDGAGETSPDEPEAKRR